MKLFIKPYHILSYMNKQIILIAFIFFPFAVKASHIVGGGFKLAHVSGYNYALEFNMYYDEVNANPGLLNSDLVIDVAIYNKGTDTLMQIVSLKRVSSDFFPYADTCMIAELRTRLLVYESSVFLDPSIYNNTDGYYIVWERCCRSALITNIQNPGNSGIVFYLEFPAVVANGTSFINSSPNLPALYDAYACIDKKFIINFSNSDPDGDSLVYSLTNPLAGIAGPTPFLNPIPDPPSSSPYSLVNWNQGFTAVNPLPGLTLDSVTGQISVTPTIQGFYVFAVLCEEYRNQQKIGMTIREFRILVKNCSNLVCITPVLPSIPDDLNYAVWPNPFDDKISIFFESNSSSPFTIQIINSSGTIVKEYKVQSQTDTKYQIEIETSDLSPGLYFSRISDGSKFITRSIPKI
jgi:hypothetical protein